MPNKISNYNIMSYKFSNNSIFNKNKYLTKSRNRKKKYKLSSKYSRKKIYGGTSPHIQNNFDDLTKLREYSKKCAENLNVTQYIQNTLILFIDLLKIYHGIDEIKQKYGELTKSKFKINDYGYVNVEDFDTVLTEGNLREQMSMMIILCECFMDIFIILIKNKNSSIQIEQVNNNSRLLNLIEKRLINYLGFKDIEQLIHFYDACEMCGKDYALISISESNIPARYSGFPMKPTRISRLDNSLYELKSRNLYPPLSCMEKKFLEDRQNSLNETTTSIHENDCPTIININKLIKSGANYYTIDENSSFYKLCVVYNHYIVAGPSGATDILFHVFGIFDNYDVGLFILSCIAYMGNTPDHSIFEILLPTISYGSNYDSTLNEYEFVDNILKIYSKVLMKDKKNKKEF